LLVEAFLAALGQLPSGCCSTCPRHDRFHGRDHGVDSPAPLSSVIVIWVLDGVGQPTRHPLGDHPRRDRRLLGAASASSSSRGDDFDEVGECVNGVSRPSREPVPNDRRGTCRGCHPQETIGFVASGQTDCQGAGHRIAGAVVVDGIHRRRPHPIVGAAD
jgi:hypothetical protein